MISEGPETPFDPPESRVDAPEPPPSFRAVLRRPTGRAIVNVVVAVLVIIFLEQARRIFGIMNTNVEQGTVMWLVCVLIIASSLISALFLVLTPRFWSWSVMAWALVVPLVALLGFRSGLNPAFVFRWDVFLPWALLPITLFFDRPYGKPRHQ